MKFLVPAAIAFSALLGTPAPQAIVVTGVGRGGSEHVRTEWAVDGAKLVVEYGRPLLRGRPDIEMMPSGREWRTGADAATVLRTSMRLRFGKLLLKPGSYTVFTRPADEWQLILGKLSKEGQWGSPYNPQLELGRVPMSLKKRETVLEQLTISISDTRAGGLLKIEWGRVLVTTPFVVDRGVY